MRQSAGREFVPAALEDGQGAVTLHDVDDAIALNVRIASILRDRIVRGEWAHGAVIPGINDLAAAYRVARSTARQALQRLVKDGLIVSERGRGSRVIHRAPPFETSDAGLVQALEPGGPGHAIRVLERTHGLALPALLRPEGRPHDGYTRVCKVHSQAGRPYGYFEGYVATEHYRRFPARADEREKLLHLLCRSGMRIVRRREVLTIRSADWREAGLLQGAMAMPVARVLRTLIDDRRRIAYAADNLYRGDTFRLDRAVDGPLVEASSADPPGRRGARRCRL